MPGVRDVDWAPQARRDLQDIWRYYARVASPEVADRILREISDAAERLADKPTPGRSRNELRPGLRSLLVHPHTIFFRLQEPYAQVARVLHERRDFPALLRDDLD